ncbi:MAG TPA: FAD-dependent monooxygenase [Pyrinomonadaceae bacterium]|nr:FAD-dependent monooxygenase [Pyrinomonadaceae bacterium]
MNQTTDVLISGAGPTGLSLACQLIRHGIDFVILDKKEGVTPYSKAIGVQARTLEIYEQLDLAGRAVAEGTIAEKARLLAEGEVRAEIDFSQIGKGFSAYPFVLMLEQSKNEKLLYEYMQAHGQEVLWNTELVSLTQSDLNVTARVKTSAGDETQTIEAKYLAGCDGPRSLVRHSLGLEFSGSTFERMFYVADAQVDWQFTHDALHVCLAKESFAVFFPLKGEKRYRIVGVFPEEFAKAEGDVLYEEIEQRTRQLTHFELDIHDVEWFSTYKVHTRHASRFSAGRCFLAGDAAHIHSPAGAQGMNTGIQDAYNLAWKLASVLQNHADQNLLETYNEERLENAKNLLRTTDRIFQFVAGDEWWLALLRTNILPPIGSYLLGLDSVRGFIFPLVSQTGINYRHSSLSHHAGDEDFKVKAGDRMPYFVFEGSSIYDRLREPKFHLLAFSNDEDERQALQANVEGEHAGSIDFHGFQLDEQSRELFGADRPFIVFLRPDNYIAFISNKFSFFEVENYRRRTLIG